MNTKELLLAARKKIERPENWTRGDYARDSEGRWLQWDSKHATCWCVIGALRAVANDDEVCWRALRALGNGLPDERDHVAAFNDRTTTTHADVLALFDAAIAAQDGDK